MNIVGSLSRALSASVYVCRSHCPLVLSRTGDRLRYIPTAVIRLPRCPFHTVTETQWWRSAHISSVNFHSVCPVQWRSFSQQSTLFTRRPSSSNGHTSGKETVKKKIVSRTAGRDTKLTDKNEAAKQTAESQTGAVDSSKGNGKGESSSAGQVNNGTGPAEPVPEQHLSVFQRFKKTYKEHGKILIGVHGVTSAVWFGSFYYMASTGFDIVPLLEWLGASEKIIKPFKSSLGSVAIAYAMYKLATPARYTVTLAGTNFMIKYFRRSGKLPQVADSAKLSVLVKDSRKTARAQFDHRRGLVKKVVRTHSQSARQKAASVRTKILQRARTSRGLSSHGRHKTNGSGQKSNGSTSNPDPSDYKKP